MFSLGMVICSIFNNGKSLIQSQNSPSAYLKQLETVSKLEIHFEPITKPSEFSVRKAKFLDLFV